MRRHILFFLLGFILLLFYWLPILWWILSVSVESGIKITPGLPLGKLIYRTTSLSIISSILSVLAAYPFVILWRLSKTSIRHLLLLMMVLPLLMGLLARNYSWIGLLSNPGIIGSSGRVLFGSGFLYSIGAIIVVMVCIFVPVSFFILIQGARAIRTVQIDAARTLGVPDWKIVFKVLIPLTTRAALLAFCFTFSLAVGFFVTPNMIGGGKYDFIGNAILMYVDLGSFEVASSLGVIFLGIMIIPSIGIALYALKRRKLISGR